MELVHMWCCSGPAAGAVTAVCCLALQLVADLVRRWKCIMPSSTLDCLVGLRFPDITTPVTPGELRWIWRPRASPALLQPPVCAWNFQCACLPS